MKRSSGFKFLIYFCVLILTGLVAIQFYLLRNTYKLNRRDYHSQILAAVLKLNASQRVKELDSQSKKILREASKQLSSGKIDKKSFEDLIQRLDSADSKQFDSLVVLASDTNTILKGVKQRNRYSLITLEKDGQVIFKDKDIGRDPTQNINGQDELISLGQNTGTLDYDNNNDGRLGSFSYVQQMYLQIPRLPISVIKELCLVGGLSFLLLISVIIVYFRVFRAGQKQKKLSELRIDLVNNITHELKTPLSSMSIAFETLDLIDEDSDSRRRNELIANLKRQHKKLSETIERVMESAVDSDVVTQEIFNIADLLSIYLKDNLVKSHTLTNGEITPCMVKGPSELVEAILDNLVDNAQKYTPAGTTIKIRGHKEQEFFRVDVIDEGAGISKEYQQFLFEKFFRVPQQNVHTIKGLGLGLFLSKQAAVRMGGDLRLTSSSAKGTIFSLYLPLA